MSCFLRLVDSEQNTINGWKVDWCNHEGMSIREKSLEIAKNMKLGDTEVSCLENYDLDFEPWYIEVVKKRKTNNGRIIKNVIYRKELAL